MSDETTPKLRLRPKLAGAQPAVTPVPVKPPAEPAPVEESPPARSASGPTTLRPKLSLKPEEPEKTVEPPQPIFQAPKIELENAEPEDPRAFPPPPAKPVLPAIPPRLRPSLTPAGRANSSESSGAVPPFPVAVTKDKLPAVLNAPPPRLASSPKSEETWPAVLDAPPPPGLAPTIAPLKAEEEPAEITAIRKASTFPFPAPTTKFPPLPGLGTAGDSIPPETSEQEGFLKKLLLIGVLVIVLLAAAVFAYFKFLAKPSDKPASTPAPSAGQSPVMPSETKVKPVLETPAAVKAATGAQPAPTPAISATETPPTTPAPVATPDISAGSTERAAAQEPAVTPEAAPVAVKAPPPQPSLAFKAWVINLRIRGVRGGDAQRVFIDKTSYVPGDVVNQQLGIIFVGYDESNRMLTFQDKSGATFERRH